MTVEAVSAEELLRMAEDGHRYELVHGEVRKMALPGESTGLWLCAWAFRWEAMRSSAS
jgi:hypothetical protein